MQMQGLGGFNGSTNSMSQMPGNIGQNGNGSFDLM